MFAVIKTGGKQYRVAADDVITIERRTGAPGDVVTFDDVLMLTGTDGVQVGAPTVAGATVGAEIVEHTRGPKVIAFKKRRRKNSRRKRGYRDEITVLRITEILADNAKPSIGPRPKREKVAAPPADDADEAPRPAKKAAAKKPAAKAKAKPAAKPRAKPDTKKPDAKKPAAKKAAAKGKSDKK